MRGGCSPGAHDMTVGVAESRGMSHHGGGALRARSSGPSAKRKWGARVRSTVRSALALRPEYSAQARLPPTAHARHKAGGLGYWFGLRGRCRTPTGVASGVATAVATNAATDASGPSAAGVASGLYSHAGRIWRA